MKIHKVLKNSPKKKLYHHLKEEIMQNQNLSSKMIFDLSKIPKTGAKPKIWLKITLNDLNMTFEVKVDLWSQK